MRFSRRSRSAEVEEREARHETPGSPNLEQRIDEVPIKDEVIRLGQFLKLANLVDSGSDAKSVIAEGNVVVNGEIELRRGRQLGPGDVVEHDRRKARVVQGNAEIDVPW